MAIKQYVRVGPKFKNLWNYEHFNVNACDLGFIIYETH